MTTNLTCNQVSALLSFYIEDRLNNQLKKFVEQHLETCPTCKSEYEALKRMITSLKELSQNISNISPEKQQLQYVDTYTDFKANLSAYVDNELSDEDNIKIKKYTISNLEARGELEEIYELKKLLRASFDKNKDEMKYDFTKSIMSKMDFQNKVQAPDYLLKAVSVFIIAVFFFALSFLIVFAI